MDFKEIQ